MKKDDRAGAETELFRTEKIPRILLKIAPPVMLAQLIQAMYNIVDSFFVGQYSETALTAMGLQTCIVPVLSFNYATKSYLRCRETMKDSYLFSCVFMLLGVGCFVFFPTQLLKIFSNSSEVIEIGKRAFPIIGTSFIPAVFSLMTPVFFQAIGNGKVSLFLSVMRQIFCLIPIFWGLSLIGLSYTWFAFPISEVLVGSVGMILYQNTIRRWKK